MNGHLVAESESNISLLTVTASVSRRAGGLFHSVRRLSQAVAAKGTPVEVLGLDDPDSASDLSHWSPLVPRTFLAKGPVAFSPKLRDAIRESARPGVVCHLHGLWLYPSKATCDVSRRSDMPRMISPRGMLDPWALSVSAWKKRLVLALFERKSLVQAQCLHALCDSERESIRRFGLGNPVAVVPNGTDLPGAEPAEYVDPAQRDWRGRPILLYLGRIHPKKGILPLLEGWAKARADIQDWVLAVAGPNEVGHREEVESRIDALGIGCQVRLIGPQFGSAKDAWLRRASAFVLTSHSEGFPMAVLEAMAHRLPVLLSPTCNFPEAVQAGAGIETAVEPDAIAEALRSLLSRPAADLVAMGDCGRGLVARDYTWDRIAEQMIEVYQWMSGRANPPVCVRFD